MAAEIVDLVFAALPFVLLAGVFLAARSAGRMVQREERNGKAN